MYETIKVGRGAAPKSAVEVFFIFDDRKVRRSDADRDKALDGALSGAVKRPECTGALGEATIVDGKRRCVLVGLGKVKSLGGAALRAAGGVIVNVLDRMGAGAATVFAGGLKGGDRSGPTCVEALGEGIGLGSFSFSSFKELTLKKPKQKTLTVYLSRQADAAVFEHGLQLAQSTNYARQWAATPPNVATTTAIAKEAQRLARSSKGILQCHVIKGAALEREKLTGLINVGKASENEPCLIELKYSPKGRSTGTVVLVGKTLCYDTGGLSLKISNGMKGMKYDKNGGMAVLGAMHAVMRIKPRCKVVALLPTAENSVSDEAYRPDDIIKYPNGVQVEVTNTDAEGRLVLADALAYGCRKNKPDAIIDLATLTGGVVIALGRVCAGLFCDDDKLRARVEAAAEATGERVWRLPLWSEYRDMMKSKHADIWNSAPVREAHPIQGAAFLSYFVEEGIPWAHIDIAGTSSIDSDSGPFAAGPTGFGVRLLAELLDRWR